MRRSRRPGSDFPDVPRADLPPSAFRAYLFLSEGTEAASLCWSCISHLAQAQGGIFQRMPRPRPSVRQNLSGKTGKRGRNNIRAVSPKCSHRRFTRGIHEIVRVSAKSNTNPPRPRGPDTPVMKQHRGREVILPAVSDSWHPFSFAHFFCFCPTFSLVRPIKEVVVPDQSGRQLARLKFGAL